MPTFHEHSCITVNCSAKTIQLDIQYFPMLGLKQITSPIKAQVMQQFQNNAANIPGGLKDYYEFVRDGIAFRCQYYDVAGVKTEFLTDNPLEETPHYQLTNLVFQLAWDTFENETAVKVLENLFTYLRFDQLVLKDIGGNPYHIRLFSGLSWSSRFAQELEAKITSIPAHEPLLMDLRNFEGMGMAYYALFQKLFLNRTQTTIWIEPALSHARKQLLAIGIPENTIVHSYEAALAKFQGKHPPTH